MISLKFVPWLFFLYIPSSIIFAQTTGSYTAYQKRFQYVTSCLSNYYYDIAMLQCSPCPDNAIQKKNDITQCECIDSRYYYSVNQGGGSLICSLCNTTGSIRTTDGFGCTTNTTCSATSLTVVAAESELNGALYTGKPSSAQVRDGSKTCISCVSDAWANSNGQRCASCADATPNTQTTNQTITCCSSTSDLKDGVCLTNVIGSTSTIPTLDYSNRFSSPSQSLFFQQHLEAAVYLCRMNLSPTTAQSSDRTLLSNGTACQILGNIAAMQLFYPKQYYAYWLYQTYIWEPSSSSVWSSTSIRASIPFLAYPPTYYSEINNASYDWIPTSNNPNDTIRIKLAKYSATGKYLGLFDAFDSYIQLCGGGYTDGRPAFTFGTHFKKTCEIRAEALWNSNLYETAFFDPYILFTKSNTDYILPTPVVIKNYQSADDATPNQNDDESKWVYHRRFFLLDRISGVTPTNDSRNVYYAKSIKILYTLSPGGAYLQPPVFVIEYKELVLTDISKGTIAEISFETEYRMNLDSHIRDIWIAIGVLCGLGIILAFIQTTIWYSRAGKLIIDLETIANFILFNVNIIGTIFFIVMAGVSLWWLIFFKRQGSTFLVIPSTAQQATFTALVVVAFILKTIDIFHVIFRQSNIDIFFMDWEKSKTADINNVSVWRSCFAANEFNELQTFRYISVTFQIIFVLFFLKVINLEYVATVQPGVSLFPSSADYIPGYNGILRVGIAFSMWLATALVQYLVYILFYQRFVQDQVINFIDLCSIANISIFIFMDNQYGYYIHGQSPHGTTDVNIQDMMLNLERETNRSIGTRGLEPNSDDQIFIVRTDRAFRSQYELLLRNYQNRILTRAAKKGEDKEAEVLLATYRHINDFLCSFISHKLPKYNYSVRPRVLLEKIFNCELRGPAGADQTESILYIDHDRNFIATIFAGYENSLFIWNTATFLFIDYFASNYVLAAIITYLLNSIAVKIRTSLGEKNLSKKTLMPDIFLI